MARQRAQRSVTRPRTTPAPEADPVLDDFPMDAPETDEAEAEAEEEPAAETEKQTTGPYDLESTEYDGGTTLDVTNPDPPAALEPEAVPTTMPMSEEDQAMFASLSKAEAESPAAEPVLQPEPNFDIFFASLSFATREALTGKNLLGFKSICREGRTGLLRPKGPLAEVQLAEVEKALAASGKALYEAQPRSTSRHVGQPSETVGSVQVSSVLLSRQRRSEIAIRRSKLRSTR